MLRILMAAILISFASSCGEPERAKVKRPAVPAGPIADNADQTRGAKFLALSEEQIKLVHAAVDVMERITDEQTALTGADELNQKARQARDVAVRFRAIGMLTAEEAGRITRLKSLDDVAQRHSKANKKLGAFLEKATLSSSTEKAVRAGLLEWGLANIEISEAMLAVLPPKGSRKP